jgi:hypothetical protein
VTAVLADHVQPLAAATETEPVEALAATETDVSESVGAQTAEVVKVFDTSLTPLVFSARMWIRPPQPLRYGIQAGFGGGSVSSKGLSKGGRAEGAVRRSGLQRASSEYARGKALNVRDVSEL